LRFDSRPNDVRPGHLLFCVEPEKRVAMAVVESLAEGSETLHDFEATDTERWLFALPVRALVVVADLAAAPPMPQTGASVHFSYKSLTSAQAARLTSSLLPVA
jgi:hypothetical protein